MNVTDYLVIIGAIGAVLVQLVTAWKNSGRLTVQDKKLEEINGQQHHRLMSLQNQVAAANESKTEIQEAAAKAAALVETKAEEVKQALGEVSAAHLQALGAIHAELKKQVEALKAVKHR